MLYFGGNKSLLMHVLEFQWRKYVNVGSIENPVWSRGLIYTYSVDLKGLEIEKLPEGFITNLLIQETIASSSGVKKFLYLRHEIKSYNRADDESAHREIIRKLIASEIAKQDD